MLKVNPFIFGEIIRDARHARDNLFADARNVYTLDEYLIARGDVWKRGVTTCCCRTAP